MKNWSATEYMAITKELESAFGANGTASIYGLSAYAHAMEEMEEAENIPVKGTRHPSTRHERWKLTTDHKKADRQKATALGMNSPWKEPTRSKWIDPYLKHSISAGDWRLALKGKATSKQRRADGKREVAQFMQTVPEPELTDQVWEKAWKEYEEEQAWERLDAEEWEDMQTFDEIEEYYSHESGLARDTADEPDDNLSPVGIVLERGVTCEGMRFVCEDEEAARWLFHRLFAFYPDTDFSPKFVSK